ncbi:hypothetical protein ACT7DB_01085 [Bacillus cereus]
MMKCMNLIMHRLGISFSIGKIPDGRTIYLTTDGYVRGGVLDDLKERKVVWC